MKLEPLPPIPCPPAQNWRQFRVHFLPPLSFVAVLFLTAWLWNVNMVNPILFGTAEGRVADVTSIQAGRIANLNVELYQDVKAGDVIAVVDSAKPEVLTNQLALIRAQIESIRAAAGYDTGDKVRYAQLELSWLAQRAELVSLRVKVTWAEAEFNRVAQLMKENIAFQLELDTAKRDLEDSKGLLAAKEALVEQSGQVLKNLNPDTLSTDTPAVRAAIAVAEQQLNLVEAQSQPVYLLAPISGRISKLTKVAGSNVAAAEIVATVADPKVDRILAYISQPVRLEPKVGMEVEIRTRGAQRVLGHAKITQVGPRIEVFTGPLKVRGMGAVQERGIPFEAGVPADMRLLPGELVDVTILPLPKSES